MKSSEAVFTVGELAARFGLATHVLRHWETVGLLRPTRLANGRRRYGQDDVYRVATILSGKEVGFGLDVIRDVLLDGEAGRRREILHAQHAELAERIARMRSSLDFVEKALNCKHGDFTRCPNFRNHIADRIPPVPDCSAS